MAETNALPPNTFYIEVTGSGIPEVDGLFVPSTPYPSQLDAFSRTSPINF